MSKIRNLFTLTILLLSVACGGGTGGSQNPDPVVLDLPVAYIQRTIPTADNGAIIADDILEPQQFKPSAALYIKDRATPTADAVNVTARLFQTAAYDIKDLSPSSDGRRLVFALRAPEIEDADEDEQPSWNIWEYDLDTDQMRRIISSDIVAEQGHDVAPAYLPDDRIVFSSTRQQRSRAILLDDNKPQFSALDEDRQNPAFNLHVVSNDGATIEQITFNQSHDLQPSVLPNGNIIYNRWDNFRNNAISLYTVDPYGFNNQLLYGYHSQNSGTDGAQVSFQNPTTMLDGRLLVQLKSRDTSTFGGDIAIIDTATFVDNSQPTDSNIGLNGPAQSSVFNRTIRTDDSPSADGRYYSANPFADGTDRLLVSWSQCSVINPATNNNERCSDELLAIDGITEAPPSYGLWIFDSVNQTQQPLIPPQNGVMFVEGITLESRPRPDFIPAPIGGTDIDQDLVDANLGVLNIRSVYDIDGTDVATGGIATIADPLQTSASERPARYLRLIKAVSLPDRDTLNIPGYAFGRSGGVMREILGYVPIEPDGSVQTLIPADVAFSFEVLDNAGKRISQRHDNWLAIKPGEVKQCRSCHTNNGQLPHGRADAEAASAHFGATVTGVSYPNTEPALFANSGETMAEVYARINGTREPSVDISYTDEWTDANVRAKDADEAFLYSDLGTDIPTSASCQSDWNALCRTIIHYPTHIQPLWNLDRQQFDGLGALISDNTCTSCHTPRDAMDALKDPDDYGQLELTDTASPEQANQFVSFRELLFNDVPQELVDGALRNILIDVPRVDDDGLPVFETDPITGELVLDINGDPIQIIDQVETSDRIRATMSAGGANNSDRFFDKFATGGTHEAYLSPAELRLIAEWLDIGAQYYNNPFDVPAN